jgi:DNA mismatch repair ATPase MutS
MDSNIILELSDRDSLVLIDELGRGTNYLDGLSFALTLSKHLILKNSFVFFVTHFLEMIGHLRKYKTVNVLKSTGFTVSSGINEEEAFGIEICRGYFPLRVIDDALS